MENGLLVGRARRQVEWKQGHTSGQMAVWDGDVSGGLGFSALGTGCQERSLGQPSQRKARTPF